MRALGYILTFCLLTAVASWGGGAAWREAGRIFAGRGIVDQIGVASASIVYAAPQGKWVEFPVTGLSPKLRMLTHADVSADLRVTGDEPLSYGLLVEFFDAKGQVLETRRVRHMVRVSDYRDLRTGKAVVRNFYLGHERVATEVKTTTIPILAGSSRLRVRTEQADPRFLDVWMRLYDTEPTTESRLSYQWQRLARAEQEHLARGNVYPPEFLTESERLALLRRRWKSMGPSGVEGRDYVATTLYSLPSDSIVRVPNTIPAGQFIDEQLHGSVPIPASGGRIRLELLSAEDGTRLTSADVQVTWLGTGGFVQRWQRRLSSDPDGFLRVEVPGGLLDVFADRRSVLRSHIEMEDGGTKEITPLPLRVRTFLLSPGETLDFPITHAGRSATLVRVNLACVCFQKEMSMPEAVRTSYELLDSGGTVVRGGTLVHTVKPASHELIDSTPDGKLSALSHHHFRLPSHVTRLRLRTDHPVLAAAYNRPEGMSHRVNLPEDANLTERDGIRRTWFYLQPVGADRLVMTEKTMLIETRLRSSSFDDLPLLLAGRYRIDDFTPPGDWQGRYILEPHLDNAVPRDTALVSVFSALPTAKDVQAVFIAAAPAQTVVPILIYRMGGSEPARLRISLDARTIFDGRVRPGLGELSLGSFPAGPHVLRVDGKALMGAYVNYLRPSGAHYVRRLAITVDGRPLRLPIRKESGSTETIVGSYYGASRDAVCRINVRQVGSIPAGPGPFESVTVAPLVASMTVPRGADVLVPGSARPTAASGLRFFFTLGDDLAPGPLSIDMEFTQSCAGGYLTLRRLLPGRDPAPSATRHSLSLEEL